YTDHRLVGGLSAWDVRRRAVWPGPADAFAARRLVLVFSVREPKTHMGGALPWCARSRTQTRAPPATSTSLRTRQKRPRVVATLPEPPVRFCLHGWPSQTWLFSYQ